MAYLFIDGVENAVVVQSVAAGISLTVEVGPRLNQYLWSPGQLEPGEAGEFAVETTPGEDPGFVAGQVLANRPAAEHAAYRASIAGNKIGGTPCFHDCDIFPGPGPWRLLAQFAEDIAGRTELDFGGGSGYIFLTPDGKSGRFVCQSRPAHER